MKLHQREIDGINGAINALHEAIGGVAAGSLAGFYSPDTYRWKVMQHEKMIKQLQQTLDDYQQFLIDEEERHA